MKLAKRGLAARTFGLGRPTAAGVAKVPSPAAVLAEAKRVASQSTDPEELKVTRDQTKHIAEWYRERGAKLEEQNPIAEGRLRLERKLGVVLRPIAEAAQKKGSYPDASTPSLGTIGITWVQSSIWQKIAKLKGEVFEDRIATAHENALELTTTYLLRGHDGPSVAFSSASNEWYTPKDYVEAARRVLGAIDLDPASCAKANATVQAERYFTEKDDGLSQPWPGRIWLNPPYGKKEGESSAGVWAARLAEQYHEGNTRAAVLLVNASTEQKWFQPLLAEFPCCLTDHRIAFAVAGEEEPKSPINGNAFFYFGSDGEKFAAEFSAFGVVVRPFKGNGAA